jgi:hypothetical protein
MNGGEEEHMWIIGGKTERKRPPQRSIRRLVDNIRMDLREIA